jgi:L-alanine-DL-glutamate epimerase-like enolase superfamily enzyme
MKITRIEPMLLNLPIRLEGAAVPMTGGAPKRELQALLVRVDTDEGLTGWGEAFAFSGGMATHAAIQHVLAPRLVGRDATQIAPLMRELFRGLYNAGRSGPVVYGISGIDIALWDIAARRAGEPLYKLLGGSATASIPAYASLMRYGDAAAVSRCTEEALERGYRTIKLHENRMDTIGAARRAAGEGVPIMVDCSCPWTVNEALDMSQRLLELDLMWLEEPIYPPDDHAGLARLRRDGAIPVAAGENVSNLFEFKRLFEIDALSYAQPSITKIGGVSEQRKVFALAESFNVPVVPHSPYFGPGLLASAHVCAAAAQPTWIERYYSDFELHPYGDTIHPVHGDFPVPQGPGVGPAPDMAIIARLRAA